QPAFAHPVPLPEPNKANVIGCTAGPRNVVDRTNHFMSRSKKLRQANDLAVALSEGVRSNACRDTTLPRKLTSSEKKEHAQVVLPTFSLDISTDLLDDEIPPRNAEQGSDSCATFEWGITNEPIEPVTVHQHLWKLQRPVERPLPAQRLVNSPPEGRQV